MDGGNGGNGGNGGSGNGGGPPADARIVLDAGTRHQTMRGWEATAEAGQWEIAYFPLYRDRLAEWAVDSVGLDRLRLEVRAGAENPYDYFADVRAGRINNQEWRCRRYEAINDNADPFVANPAGFNFTEMDLAVETIVLPIKRRLEARGERLFLNVNYIAFTGQCASARYDHLAAPEYAEFVLTTVRHLRDRYGLVPDTWEVILEPDNGTPWRGPLIGAAIAAASTRLSEAGFDIRFVAPSTMSMSQAVPYFDQIVQVPGARSGLAELSYHRYAGVSESNLRTIAARGAQHGVATAMLEHIGSGHEELERDLEIGNASAWQQFVLAFEGADRGDAYLKVESSGGGATIRLASRTRYLRRYFEHVRLGAVRIGATSSNGDYHPLAFVNADGGVTVVVRAEDDGTMAIAGLPAGSYGVSYTTDDEQRTLPDVIVAAGEELRTAIPDDGVLVVWRR